MSDTISLSEAIAHMEQGGICEAEDCDGDVFLQRFCNGRFEYFNTKCRPIQEDWLKDETSLFSLMDYKWRKAKITKKVREAPALQWVSADQKGRTASTIGNFATLEEAKEFCGPRFIQWPYNQSSWCEYEVEV